jgi:hypothetical protein
MGPAARPALPQLLPLIRHPDAAVQEAARAALKSIDPATAIKIGVR